MELKRKKIFIEYVKHHGSLCFALKSQKNAFQSATHTNDRSRLIQTYERIIPFWVAYRWPWVISEFMHLI